MKSKKIVVGILCACALCLGIFFLVKKPSDGGSKSNDVDLSKYDLNSVIEPSEDNGNIGDHVKGDVNAPLTIFEYADYQCSGCANMTSVVDELLKEYDGKLRIVFRVFPLTSIHPNAIAAASAVEAAGLQGHWQDYGDLLFMNQGEWFNASGSQRTDLFMGYFTVLTGDEGSLTKFRQDMASLNVKKKIEFDKKIAEEMGIQATPSFFGPDGKEIPWTEQENLETRDDVLKYFRTYIESELEKQEKAKEN